MAGPSKRKGTGPSLLKFPKERRKKASHAPLLLLHLRRCPTTGDVDPLGKTGAVLALDIDNVRVTSAAATNAVLLGLVPAFPVLVLLDSFPLVQGGRLKERGPGELSRRGIGRAVLDRRVSVSKVSEVVNVPRGQKSTGSQRVDGSISPLVTRLV